MEILTSQIYFDHFFICIIHEILAERGKYVQNQQSKNLQHYLYFVQNFTVDHMARNKVEKLHFAVSSFVL